MATTRKINLLDLSEGTLAAFLQGLDEPRYRTEQIIQWIHQRGVTSIDAMTNLSKKLRAKLTECAEIVPLQPLLEQHSADGTYKWLFQVDHDNAIETVFIPEANRGTLCVSSQVGCALNCSFCATGKEGFNRNLSVGEIIGQVWVAVRKLAPEGLDKNHAITNIVMMGMGEPLLNYDAVVAALKLMMSDHAYGLSKYRVTVSTSGVIPAMKRLQQECPVSLAVSLHAPDDALREQLVPLNKKYPLNVLMAACKGYFPQGSKRVVTFEYVMLRDVNDRLSHANSLIKLLKSIPCKVNLIPFNPFPGTNYQTSHPSDIEAFQRCLMKAGINTWVRKTRGDDIEAACGQLAGQIKDRTGRHLRWRNTGRLTTTPRGLSQELVAEDA